MNLVILEVDSLSNVLYEGTYIYKTSKPVDFFFDFPTGENLSNEFIDFLKQDFNAEGSIKEFKEEFAKGYIYAEYKEFDYLVEI